MVYLSSLPGNGIATVAVVQVEFLLVVVFVVVLLVIIVVTDDVGCVMAIAADVNFVSGTWYVYLQNEK